MDTLTRLAEWIVPQAEIDHLGHMSTLFYAQRAEQGAAALVGLLGGDAGALAAEGLMIAVVDHHTHFRREQLVGAPLALSGGVIALSGNRIDLYQEMANAETGEVAAMFRSGLQLQHRATREPAPLPGAWLDAAARLTIEPPGRSQPRSLALDRMGADLTPADFARVGIASHVRREITADLCDTDGFIAPVVPKLVASFGPYNQGVMDHVWGSVQGFVWPALEMRTLTLRTPRQGDLLDSYAALLSVSHKIIHSAICVFDARDDALVSVSHQVNIFFRLSTRRPQDMPTDARERLTALSSPELIGAPEP